MAEQSVIQVLLLEVLVRHIAVSDYHPRILRNVRAWARLRSTSAPVVSRSLWLPLNQGITSLQMSYALPLLHAQCRYSMTVGRMSRDQCAGSSRTA